MKEQQTYNAKLIIKNLDGGGKHIFIECTIFDQKYLMLLDTGCSNTVFDGDSEVFANVKLRIPKSDQNNFSLNAPIEDVKIGKIDNFSIGKFDTNINRAIFIGLSQVNTLYETLIGQKIIGILGSDFLKRYKAVIDFGKAKLTLKK